MVVAEQQIMSESEYFLKLNQKQRIQPRTIRRFPTKLVVGLVCLIIINLVFQSLVIQREYKAQELQEMIQAKQREIAEVQVQIAKLDSYEQIQYRAQHELGMRMAGPNDYHYIAVQSSNNTTHYMAQTIPPKNFWLGLTAWFRGFGETMAKTP